MRAAAVAAVSVVAVLATAAPALAHAEVVIDNPQAGATNVTMTMTAEAESPTAGIASVRVVLPEGIAPSQVMLVSGPAAWTLTAGADGYTVAGPPLRVKTDAKYAVRLAQLPVAPTVLVFKTLVTYSDGRVDRWIEPPSAANPNPDQPAPTVTLRPAAAVPPSPSPVKTSAAPTTASAAQSPSPAAAAKSGGGGGPAWLVAGVAALAAIAGATLLAVRRRRARAASAAR